MFDASKPMQALENAPVENFSTLADSVFEKLQTAIVKGEIPPNAKISEPELAKIYGVSRGPLREAIRRLEGRKLVVHKPNAGVRVVSLSPRELLEIYYVREALESMACRLAAVHMDEDEVRQLRSVLTVHQQQSDLRQGMAYYQGEGDLDFHYRIVLGSKNSKLMDMLCGELYQLVRMYRYQFSAYSKRPTAALNEHLRIVEAIESRDAEVAEILMRRHISAARENVVAQLNEESNNESHGEMP